MVCAINTSMGLLSVTGKHPHQQFSPPGSQLHGALGDLLLSSFGVHLPPSLFLLFLGQLSFHLLVLSLQAIPVVLTP